MVGFRRAVAVLALGAAQATDQMPIAELNKEYISNSKPAQPLTANGNGISFVFLQKFPLSGMPLFFHTEVLVCPRSGFSQDDQDYLDKQIAGMSSFAEIDESWWKTRTANCVELGYGGAECSSECCSVPHGTQQTRYALNARRAVIYNADTSQKSLYIYGTGAFDGEVAYHDTCDKKCWSNWAGTDYNPLTNNCNTFTSTVLFCVFGLSQKKPNLGPSDMVTVKGHCPAKTAIVGLPPKTCVSTDMLGLLGNTELVSAATAVATTDSDGQICYTQPANTTGVPGTCGNAVGRGTFTDCLIGSMLTLLTCHSAHLKWVPHCVPIFTGLECLTGGCLAGTNHVQGLIPCIFACLAANGAQLLPSIQCIASHLVTIIGKTVFPKNYPHGCVFMKERSSIVV